MVTNVQYRMCQNTVVLNLLSNKTKFLPPTRLVEVIGIDEALWHCRLVNEKRRQKKKDPLCFFVVVSLLAWMTVRVFSLFAPVLCALLCTH